MSFDLVTLIDKERASIAKSMNDHNPSMPEAIKEDIKFELPDYSAKVIDFHYIIADPTITPTSVIQISCDNDSPVQNSFVVKDSHSKTEKASFEWGLKEDLKLGVETEFKCGLPLIAEGKVKVSATLDIGSHQDWKNETDQTWAIESGFTVNMPPRSYNLLEMIVENAELNGVFDMKLQINFNSIKYSFDRHWENPKGSHHYARMEFERNELPLPGSITLHRGLNELQVSGTFKGALGLRSVTKIHTTTMESVAKTLKASGITYDKLRDAKPSKEILDAIEKFGTVVAVIPHTER